jgi:hypothetical protein
VKNNLNIGFNNFPYDFNVESNFFLDLINNASNIKSSELPIHFYGCYPDISLFKKVLLFANSRISDLAMTKWLSIQQGVVKPIDKRAFNIWCTFENRRPPINNFDLTFSFDLDSYNNTNFYLPLIYICMNHTESKQNHAKYTLSSEECATARQISLNEIQRKTGFASAFINNPHQMRLRAIKELSKTDKINVFGRSVGNYVKDKVGEASKYWFNICFENDLYPGYVTEKILEAWMAKAIPLYWGMDTAKILNSKAYINLNDFESLEDYVNFISRLYKDEDKMIEMINQPLLNQNFNYDSMIQFLVSGLINRDRL